MNIFKQIFLDVGVTSGRVPGVSEGYSGKTVSVLTNITNRKGKPAEKYIQITLAASR